MLRNLYHLTRFPAGLEDNPVDEATLRSVLEAWHQTLAPQEVINQYHVELERAMQLTADEQIKRYVHGKKFFSQVIVQTLNDLLGQHSRKFWLERFREEHIQSPADLHPLLDWVLDQFNKP